MSRPPSSQPNGDAPAALPEVVVVDAGVGNLANVVRAVEAVGGAPVLTRDPRRVAAGRRVVLPGVGAFAAAREGLTGDLEAALRAAVDSGGWLLGICVGYQLLFEAGEEHGTTAGLGLLPGVVRRLPDGVPLPHIGWNRLHDVARREAGDGAAGARLLAEVEEGEWAYFAHGYAPEEVPEEAVLARATHGRPFAAVAGRGRVLGAQFHPERSGRAGLAMLHGFVGLAGDEGRDGGGGDRVTAGGAG